MPENKKKLPSIIPLVDLKRQYYSMNIEIDNAISRVIDSGRFISGEEVKAFEKEFAAFCGAEEAIGVASGTTALHLALLALGIGRHNEVITTPFTFIATWEAVHMTGAKAVFVDIDPHTFNIDPTKIEEKITRKTKAIIPVHLYGQPCDMDPIMEIAQKHNLYVIEDAAQAHGAEYKGRPVGTLGHAACFSFFPGKNLGAYGDAGAVVGGQKDYVVDRFFVADKIRMLRNHGRQEKYWSDLPGYNYRMDELQAAILRAKLNHLKFWLLQRRTFALVYGDALVGMLGVTVSPVDIGVIHAYHLFVVRVKNRDRIAKELRERYNIYTGIHYPIPLHLQPAVQEVCQGAYQKGDFPNAEKAAQEVLSLPLFPEMTQVEVERVVQGLRAVLGSK